MKNAAINACTVLAGWILDGSSFAWLTADRIERRFRIQGSTEAIVRAHEAARADYLREQGKRFDRLHPDRLTYLHR